MGRYRNRLGAACAVLLGASLSSAQVTLRDGTLDWKTWDVAETADHGATGQNLSRQVTRHFNTLVLENEYLVVTLLPGYGARIVSILYKPTGHEQLFRNPVGFADGIGAGSFYYDWLMVLGGIFPTFPEPEHGKTYLLPWKSEVVANTPEKISVAMSITDNVDFPRHPSRFNLGVTGLTCVATVTLEKGKAAVRLDVQLKNDRAQAVRYEYWTCHSLAPGSSPDDTKSPQSTEIVVPIQRYSIGYGTEGIDRALDGGQEYKNLAFFRNWKREGIAYAEPAVTKKWWGVLNHDNEEGIFRIASDPKLTPGLKFWTWGYRGSYPLNARERQFIELWAGAGHQFFSPVSIAANSSRSWSETYIPTAGLPGVTDANEDALVSLRTDKAAYDGKVDASFTLSADVSVAAPGSAYRAVVTGAADGSRILLDTLIQPDPKAAAQLKMTRPLGAIGPGQQTLGLKLTDAQGKTLLSTGTPVSVANAVLGINGRSGPRGTGFLILPEGGGWRLAFATPGPRDVEIADLQGRTLRFLRGVGGSSCFLAGMRSTALIRIRDGNGRPAAWRILPPSP